MILIITNTQDLTSDFVVRELTRRRLPFARLNTDEFPTLALGTASFVHGSSQYTLRWENRTRVLDFREVTAILYRRPVPPVVDANLVNPAIRRFSIDESYDFLRGIWLSLDCFWISHPEAIRKAEHKLVQLRTAQSLSFVVPRTVVTNDPLEARGLFESCGQGIIIKPLYMGFIDDPDQPRTIFTSVVSQGDIEDIETIRLAPSILQEAIAKRFDVRVTVVGDKVFSAKIEAQSLPPGIPDWRFASMDQLKHSHYTLPKSVENACVELVQQLGLEFGAIDLAVDKEGNHVFFEINPNGQWAWLETELGFPISAAIVDHLSAGSERLR